MRDTLRSQIQQNHFVDSKKTITGEKSFSQKLSLGIFNYELIFYRFCKIILPNWWL